MPEFVRMREELESILTDMETLSPSELPDLIGDLARVSAMAMARLRMPDVIPHQTPAPDSLLDVREAAATLGVSVGYVYRHHQEEPFRSFVKPFGRKLLFSRQGIQDYLSGNKRRRS